MYTTYFGLTEPPFAITPDPRYLYMSERHREGLAHLMYGIRDGGSCVQLTGEVGTGKTTLCRCLLEQLPPEVDVALILNPRLTAHELIASVCDELHAPYPEGTTSLKTLIDALYRRLLEAHERGHRTVLIIDEAQHLSPEVLEQVRLLTNLETTQQKLLQVILIGQPELVRLLDRTDLRQLAQRVTARYHLEPFNEEETHAYILHRLQMAGQSRPIFTRAALRQAHRLSAGVPRLINVLCDRALLGAFAHDRKHVDAATVVRAADEVFGRVTRPAHGVKAAAWTAAVVGAGGLLVAVTLLVAPTHRNFGARLADLVLRRAPVAATAATPPPATSLSPPAASMTAAAATAVPRVALADLLREPGVQATQEAAFAALYAAWSVEYPGPRGSLGCRRAAEAGLGCVAKTGTWKKLRRLDLPAMLELLMPTGDKRYATLTSIEGDEATLVFGEREVKVRLAEIDAYWDGPFVVLWRAPAAGTTYIRPGTRGKEVVWLRRQLDQIDGGSSPANAAAELYDERLKARVASFQRAHALGADGVVGEETLIHLAGAARDGTTPSLSRGKP